MVVDEEEEEADDQQYEGYVVGARLNEEEGLQYLIYWNGYGEDKCSYEPTEAFTCDAKDMELNEKKPNFMLVYKDKLRKCKFIRCVDGTTVELKWMRVPAPDMESQFVFNLIQLSTDITEWSLYGYDEE